MTIHLWPKQVLKPHFSSSQAISGMAMGCGVLGLGSGIGKGSEALEARWKNLRPYNLLCVKKSTTKPDFSCVSNWPYALRSHP